MDRNKKEYKRYVPGLDGLRAIAVLAVIAYHLNLEWAPGGLLGVTIFFVLSGYLITNLLLIEWDLTERIDLAGFWVRRARRLLPAMFVMLFTVTAWVTLFNHDFLARLREDFLPAVFYYSNWWYIFQDLSYFENMGTPSILTHFWSLAVEEQFYIIWPLVIFAALFFGVKKKKILVATLAVALLSAVVMAAMYNPVADPSRIYYGTDTRAFSLLIGAALAMVWPSHELAQTMPLKVRLSMDLIGSIALAAILAAIAFSHQYNGFLYRGGMVLVSVLTAILVGVLVHPASSLSRVMSFRPLVWIGLRSYGIYLWHYPIILLTTPQVDTGSSHIFRTVVQIVLTFVVAELSYRFIENPIRHGAIGKLFKDMKVVTRNRRHLQRKSVVSLSAGLLVVGISLVGLTVVPAGDGTAQESLSQTAVTVEKQEVKTSNDHAEKEKKDADHTGGKEESGKDGAAAGEGDREQDANSNESSKDETVSDPVKQEDLKSVSVIGDSVMIAAAPFLEQHYPDITIDAKVSRQLHQAKDIVEQLKQQGKLGDAVVIALGTNGAFSSKQLGELIDEIGDDREIFLVNTRVPKSWQSYVNDTLASTAAPRDHISLIDWYGNSAGHNEYFIKDGTHLTQTGAEAYASMIISKVDAS